MQNVTAPAAVAFVLELAPAVAFGFAGEQTIRLIRSWPRWFQLAIAPLCVLPYLIVSLTQHMFHWEWAALYAGLPLCTVWLLMQAAVADPEQRGNWRDAVILLSLGVAVDLRWLESAWPHGLEALGKILLVDAGLYGFFAIRQLTGAGFDFHLKWTDWRTGVRELVFFAPLVIGLGLALGFIHPHASWPPIGSALLRWVVIFFFVAIPEELFFRSWLQNLMERRVGRIPALLLASVVFGLSHFNKRNIGGAVFNWRYVLLATIAGIFYGRAWRENRRVAASTITHTFVDWIWSWWF